MGHVVNAAGDTVLIAQTGKGARNLGVVEIDLETLKPTSRYLKVDKRLDARVDRDLTAVIDAFRTGVDSLNAVRVATSAVPLEQGSPEQVFENPQQERTKEFLQSYRETSSAQA